LKKEKKGVTEMLTMGEARDEAKDGVRYEAKKDYNFVVIMLLNKEPVAKIMKYTKMSFEEIEEIAKSICVKVVI